MSSLIQKKCTACELGAPLVPDEKQNDLLKDLEGWLIVDPILLNYRKHLTLAIMLQH
mgnify:CR=1 FL=1